MKSDGGGLLGFVIVSTIFSLMKLSFFSLLRYSVSEFSSDILRGRIDRQVTIVALELSTDCDISLPSFLMGPRTRPMHSFSDVNEFGVL